MSKIPEATKRVRHTAGSYFRSIFDLESSGDLFFYAAVIGAIAGTGAVFFAWSLEEFSAFVMGQIVGYAPPGAGDEIGTKFADLQFAWWAVLAVPTLGGLACGFLVYTFAPEAEGHGTDAMVRAFHRLQGVVRPNALIVKLIASLLTIGTGGSAGREGPIAQIGAGVGSFFASVLRLSPTYRRTLMLAGAAGGVAAIFQAPMGGALFVCEVLYSTTAVEFAVVIPAVISSVIAYVVYTTIRGEGHEFIVASNLAFNGIGEIPFYLGLAVLCAVVGFFYVKCFYGLRDKFFRKLPVPLIIKPAIGGLLLGCLVLLVQIPGYLPHGMPYVLGGGYGWMQEALDGKLLGNVWWVIILLCLVKVVATSLTISSGGSGGVFAPSLFIGCMLGAGYGQLCHQLFPQQAPQPEVFALVGMGAFFAGVAKVPLTSVIMVSEMTGGYQLLLPLMLVSFLNVAILSSRVSLYEEQVRTLIDSPAHFGDFVIDVLAGMRVAEVFDPERQVQQIPQDMPLSQVVRLVASSQSSYFPVVNKAQQLVGIFSLHDIRAAFEGGGDDRLIFAQDVAVFPVLTVTPNDDLHLALRKCTEKNIDEIPVVDPENRQKVLGMLRRKELIAAYSARMSALRAAE